LLDIYLTGRPSGEWLGSGDADYFLHYKHFGAIGVFDGYLMPKEKGMAGGSKTLNEVEL
jgi:hypothetical protein